MTRVLIVDDNLTFRRQLRKLLTHAGMEVIAEAGTIAEASALVQQHHPDLAIVDVLLPGINGLEGVPKLKALSRDLHIILISAYQNFRESALQAGAEAFYAKDTLDLDTVRDWKVDDHEETT